MKKLHRVLAFLLCAVLLTALLGGCGGSPSSAQSAAGSAPAAPAGSSAPAQDAGGDEKVLHVSITASEQEKKDYEECIARFEEKHPDFKVEANWSSGGTWQEISDKLMVQIASGEAPDVIRVAVEGTRMFVHNELFMPLNEYLEADATGKELLEQIPQAAWDSFTVDGKIYEIPSDANSIILQYNPKMYADANLAEPDENYTWEQFVSDLQALTHGEGDEKVYGTMIMPTFLWPWFYANGVSPLNDDWTGSNLSDPKIKETMQNLYDLIYKYEVAPVPEANDDVGNMFAAGRTATICMGMFMVATYEANGFTDFDAGVMPRGADGGYGCFGIGGVGVTAGCKYPQEAYELCCEFAAAEVSARQAKTGTSVPLRAAEAQSEDFLSHSAHISRFYEEIENGAVLPAPDNYSEMSTIIATMGTNILTGAMDIDEAIAQADQELTESFKNLG